MTGRWLERLFAVSLLAFPATLRRRFGAEMRHAFAALIEDQRRTRGDAVALHLALRAFVDVLSAGLEARLRRAHRSLPVIAPERRAPPRRTSPTMLDSLHSDLRHAVRSLRKAPAFSLAAILVLALGIGANSAMFSAVRTAILAEPPYPMPDQLVLLDLEFPLPDRVEPEIAPWSYPKLTTLLEQPSLLVDPVAGYTRRTLTLSGTGDGEALRIEAEIVTPSYLPLLGGRAQQGRLFADDDPAAGIPEPQLHAVLDHGFWQRRFGGDPAAVGQVVRINGKPVEITGVLAPGFRGLTGASDLWLPMSSMPVLINPRQLLMAQAHWFEVVGRRLPGTTLEQLDAQLAQIGPVIDRTYPDDFFEKPIGVGARSLAEARRSPNAERSLWVLSAAALLIVLIACGNVAALFESRADGRGRSISIRSALGATRPMVVRYMMLEAALLALAGGLLGLVLARLGAVWLVRAWPASFREGAGFLERTHLDGLEVGLSGALFALVLALAVSVLFGLGPALRLSGIVRAPQRILRASAAIAGRGRSVLTSRAALVGGQTALAVMLVIGAGLMLTSLARLERVEIGARTEGLLAFQYEIARSSRLAETPNALHEALLERLRAVPGVLGATYGSPPLGEHDDIALVTAIDGAAPVVSTEQPNIGVHHVADDHFRVLGVPVLAGRSFLPSDRADSPPVVVLNQTAAKQLFGTESPIGRRIALSIALTAEGASAEVVGVVGDVLYDHPSEGIMREAYVSFRQEPQRYITALVRTDREPVALVPEVRALVRDLDPDLPIFGVRTVAQIRGDAIGDTRVLTALLLGCALLALALAAVGTYGVTAYWVAGRRRELGLRIALGARRRQVQAMVMSHGLRAVLVGIVLGTAGALAGAHLLSGLLFEVASRDPATFVAASATLLVVAALACYLPARRAARVDPATTLSDE